VQPAKAAFQNTRYVFRSQEILHRFR
jgi:hypothetical protein